MGAARKVIFPVVAMIAGTVLLLTTIQNWQADDARFQVESEKLRQEMNTVGSQLVDACLSTLPQGDPQCSDLRQDIAESCKSFDNELDVCKDGRVDSYYQGLQAVSTSDSSNIQAAVTTLQSDIRCFSHVSGVNPGDNDWSFYTMEMFSEAELSQCDEIERQNNEDPYAAQINANSGWGKRGLFSLLASDDYKQIQLLNGTKIIDGEKRIQHIRSCDPYGGDSPYHEGCPDN